jgi:TolB-like protein/DNA-binding winged helix-turn-helix (wHTH) protein/Tfp pilus assembly protein PilF
MAKQVLSAMTAPKLKFGDFELDIAQYELTRSGHPIKLERIPMELLLLLVDRRGQLVTREEILEKLWGKDVFLDVDNSINAAISKIRAALKDEPENPTFIKTVSGKGYRFIASIRSMPDGKDALGSPLNGVSGAPESTVAEESALELESKASSRPRRLWLASATASLVFAAALAAWSWRDSLKRIVSPRPSPVIRSLAVLPLENLTGDASQEYFADGMTDALITDLAQIGGLRVISRTSIMRYKGQRKPLPEIGRELGVDGIVEGTVVRSAGRIRITSQLIYAPSDRHLWARSYESALSDIVTLQGEVAQAIAGQVRAAVTSEQRSHLARRPTDSPEAYQLYLQGRYFWNQRTPRGIKKSVDFFQQAVEKDPNFALAYAGLADAYNFSNILGVLAPRESSPEAEAAAVKALVLDPQLGEAHTALGLVKSHYHFDFPGAQREFLKAIEFNPNYANAHLFYAGAYLTPMGRHEEAIAEMKKALEVDPLSLPLSNMMGQTYLWAGDYQKALQQFQRTIDLDPTFPLVHFFYAGLLAEMGRYAEAIKENQTGELLLGTNPEEAGALAEKFRNALQVGGPRRYWQKNLEITLKEYKQAGTEYFPAIGVAGAYARVGDKGNAFKWLDKSFQDREGQDITLVRWLPDFKTLHADPRFADLLRQMGLPN